MSPRVAIDLTATVTTPENIQFEYRIAGPFRRMPAFVLDLVVRAAILVGVSIALTCSGIFNALALPGSLIPVILLITVFLLDWFYGLFFETYWNGKTPGKWFTKIQVISADGRPISAYQATIRNFLRSADIAPFLSFEVFGPDLPPMYGVPTGLVAFLCMLFTKRFQRLGDLAAGTMVVVDERSWVPPNVKFEDPRVEALAQYIPASFRMSRSMGRAIALYAERRNRMPLARRLELASILAKPLMQRFGFREDTSSDLLLCALYYREFVIKQIGAPGESNVKHTQPPVPIPTASTTLGQATQAPPVLSVVAEEMSTSPTDRGANR
jgi:uncharacterized RDD family membrane protein YckC